MSRPAQPGAHLGYRKKENNTDTKRRNNGVKKAEAFCEGRGESRRPERRYRKERGGEKEERKALSLWSKQSLLNFEI